MTRHIIEAPDGTRHVIEVPDGPAVGQPPQAPAKAPPAAPGPFQRAGGYGPVLAGVADAGIRGALGIKQLFGGSSDEDKAVLRELEAEKKADPEGGWRTAGDVGANIALTAIPGAKGAQALNKTRALAALGRAAPAVNAAAISGGTEALLAPGEGDTFGEQLASKGKEAAKAAALGGVLHGAVSAAARPFKPSQAAQSLMDQKVYPTLAQGSEGKFGKFVGGLTSGVFPTSNRQSKEVVNAALRDILPDTPPSMFPTKTSDVAKSMLDVGDEYGALFHGKKFTMSSKDKGEIWAAGLRAAGRQPDVKKETLSRLGGSGLALRSNNTVRLSPESMVKERQYLQDQIDLFKGDTTAKGAEIRRGLIAAKNKFDEIVRNRALSADEMTELKALNARNFDAKRMLDAAGKAESRRGQGIRAQDLVRSYRDMDPTGGVGFATAKAPLQEKLLDPAMEVVGDSLNQDQARSLMVALGRAGGKTMIGGASMMAAPGIAAPLYATSLLGQTKQGSRALFGDYAIQKKIAEELRKRGGIPAIGSALTPEEGEY